MLFTDKFLFKRALFLGLLVSGLSGSILLNAQVSYLEQAFLFGYGLATRYGAHQAAPMARDALSEAIPQEAKEALFVLGKEMAEYANATIDNTSQMIDPEHAQRISRAAKSVVEGFKGLVVDMTPVLAGINIAIALWVAGLFVYEKARARITGVNVPFEVEGSAVAQLLRRSHLGGMDSYWCGVSALSMWTAAQKLSEMPEVAYRAALAADNQEDDAIRVVPVVDDIQFQSAQSLATGIAGLLIGFASFNLMSVPLATEVTKSMSEITITRRFIKNVVFLGVVFDVGIVLAASTSRALFYLFDDFLKGCHACKETYQAGEDAAYVISDVFANWYGMYLQEVNVKPKID